MPLDGTKTQTMSCHRPWVGWAGRGRGGRKNSLPGFYLQKNLEPNYDYLQEKEVILIENLFPSDVLVKPYELAVFVCQQRLNIDSFI